MLQIALVPHEHDDDILIGVVPQLLEPAGHVLVCCVLGYVVYQESTDCTAVVG